MITTETSLFRVEKRLKLGELFGFFNASNWDNVLMLDLPKCLWQDPQFPRVEDDVIATISSHSEKVAEFDAYAFGRDEILRCADFMEVRSNLLMLFSGKPSAETIVGAVNDYDGLYCDFLGDKESLSNSLSSVLVGELLVSDFVVEEWAVPDNLLICLNRLLLRSHTP